jgi:hypothetical protein
MVPVEFSPTKAPKPEVALRFTTAAWQRLLAIELKATVIAAKQPKIQRISSLL